ncbi:MAG: hypothetical protein FJX77_10940, partial [Armatimonadetes bacterium]|nr:hypothetical protein [Armatimonadota bacterium]
MPGTTARRRAATLRRSPRFTWSSGTPIGSVEHPESRRDMDRRFVIAGGAVILGGGFLLGRTVGTPWAPGGRRAPVRIGLLSSSDPEEVALETGIQNGIRFAVEEVNNAGGVDGRPVEIRLGPPAATPDEMVAAAEYLVSQDRVVTLFGGGNSAARRRLAQQLGQTGGLLVYPRSYEGLEEHRSIVYLGLTPNQQMLPAVQFSKASGGERIYLIGNHDAYSQTAARIVSELLGSVDSSLAGLPYFCASNSTLPDLEARIVEARPDVILNTLQGAANRILFQRLNEGRFPTGAPPVVSFRLSRVDLEQIRPEWVEGTVVVGSYFETEDPQNSEFIHRYKKRFGYDQEITDAV